jgi:hypothetical protein
MSKALFLGAIAFVIGAFTFTAYVAMHDDEQPVVMFPPLPAPAPTLIIETPEEPSESPLADDAPYDGSLYDGSAPVIAEAAATAAATPAPALEPEPEQPVVAVAEAAPRPEPPPPGASCGPATCPSDWECCNQSCGICTPPGRGCSHVVCGQSLSLASAPCGPSTCGNGTVCCDPACGKCISPDEKCTPGTCLNPVTFPVSENCGMATCNVGTVCCNPRCGVCTAPGESCSATC